MRQSSHTRKGFLLGERERKKEKVGETGLWRQEPQKRKERRGWGWGAQRSREKGRGREEGKERGRERNRRWARPTFYKEM